MKYMLMIVAEASPWWNEADPATIDAMHQQHAAFRRWMDARGTAYSGGIALVGPEAATTLRRIDGDHVVSDGPYADLKEVVGGFYVVEAADDAEAEEIARHCPIDARCAIEIRAQWVH